MDNYNLSVSGGFRNSLEFKSKYCFNVYKQSIILLIIICFSTVLRAQNLDSLFAVWKDTKKSDSIRVLAYEDYVMYGYMYINPDSAILLADELHAFAKKNKYEKATASAYFLQGGSYWVKGDYEKALEYDKKSVEIKERIKDRSGMARSYNNIGSIYTTMGDFDQALEYFEKGLRITYELNDDEGIATTLGNMGVVYNSKGDYPRSLDFFEKSLSVWEKIGDKEGIASNLQNLAGIYKNQGDLKRALGNIEKALVLFEELGEIRSAAYCLKNMGLILGELGESEQAFIHFEKAMKMFEEIGDKSGIAFCLSNFSSIHFALKNYQKAMEFAEKSLLMHDEMGDKIGTANNHIQIGNVFEKQGNYAFSLKYCKKGLSIAEEIGVVFLQKDACSCLYNAYLGVGDNKEALYHYRKMILLRDSLFNKENTKKLTQIEMQYAFDKQEANTQAEQEKKDAIALQELKRQKLMRNGFMGGFAVVLLFAGIFFKQRNRINKEKQRSEELLLNILPEEVAEELKTKGEADAQLIEQVSVIFTDFEGFTAHSERVSPRQLVHDLHECFSAFDKICEKYGIEKIKTIGDAYMAAGGLPSPTSTHAQDVVNAGLEMAEFIDEGKKRKRDAGLPYFEIRIGVHTGPVVAGIVGVKKFQYDIWGDTVNTASRMESSGDVGRVNISHTTYKLIADQSAFSFENRGKIAAKGKGEIEMYFVKRA